MTEEINYQELYEKFQALYEQVIGENEKLRERITTMTLKKFNVDVFINTARDILQNGYFWCGYFVAIIVMLFIGVFRSFRGV